MITLSVPARPNSKKRQKSKLEDSSLAGLLFEQRFTETTVKVRFPN